MKVFIMHGIRFTKTLAQTLESFQSLLFNKEVIMQKILKFISQVLLSAIVAAIFVIMFIEWAAGCGETYIDSKGIHHSNECIIIK
jgi:hypothetical protein